MGRFVFILSVQSGLLQTQAAICVFLGFAAKTPKLLSPLSLPGSSCPGAGRAPGWAWRWATSNPRSWSRSWVCRPQAGLACSKSLRCSMEEGALPGVAGVGIKAGAAYCVLSQPLCLVPDLNPTFLLHHHHHKTHHFSWESSRKSPLSCSLFLGVFLQSTLEPVTVLLIAQRLSLSCGTLTSEANLNHFPHSPATLRPYRTRVVTPGGCALSCVWA